MRKAAWVAALGAVLLIAWRFSAEDEKVISRKDVPPAVLEAFDAAHPNADIREYVSETEHGKQVFEIKFREDGQIREAAYSATGRLIEIEESIRLDDLPQAVRAALADMGVSDLVEAEKVTQDGSTFFEIEARMVEDGKKGLYEMLFNADGKLLSKEKDSDDDDD